MNIKSITLLLLTLMILSCGTNQKQENSTSPTSQSQNNEILSLKDASGISFCKKSQTLMVVSDKGNLYEITQAGKVLSSYQIGEYDFEGVVCEEKQLMLAIEGEGLLRFNRETNESKFLSLEGIDFKLSKKHGIEGITKINQFYYLAIQSKKKQHHSKLLIVSIDEGTATVVRVIKEKITDSSGLEYHNHKLYILSDKKDTLYSYDLNEGKILASLKLPKFAQEGVTFGEDNKIFFANDKGSIFRYTFRDDENQNMLLE